MIFLLHFPSQKYNLWYNLNSSLVLLTFTGTSIFIVIVTWYKMFKYSHQILIYEKGKKNNFERFEDLYFYNSQQYCQNQFLNRAKIDRFLNIFKFIVQYYI